MDRIVSAGARSVLYSYYACTYAVALRVALRVYVCRGITRRGVLRYGILSVLVFSFLFPLFPKFLCTLVTELLHIHYSVEKMVRDVRVTEYVSRYVVAIFCLPDVRATEYVSRYVAASSAYLAR